MEEKELMTSDFQQLQENEKVARSDNLNSILQKYSKLFVLLIISGTIHLFIFLILALIPGEEEIDEKQVVIITEVIEKIEEEELIEEIQETELIQENVEVETEVAEEEVNEVETVEVEEVEEVEDLEEMIFEAELVTQMNPSLDLAVLGFSGMPSGASDAIGVLSGRFSSTSKRKATGAKNLNIINESLKWLAKQQKSNGTWPSDAHPNAVNGACALAFLGNGNSTHSGRYKDVVNKFVQFYLDRMPEDGGHGNHGHATPFVIMSMCDAYAMNIKNVNLREYCKKAVGYVCKTQLENGGWSGSGRSAKKVSSEVDIAQSAWYIMALVSARLADIDYPDAVLIKARRLFLELAKSQFSGQVKITSHGGQDAVFNRTHASASYLATSLIFMGEKSTNSAVQRQAKLIFDTMPHKGKRNYWLLYNQGLGLFQMGSKSKYWDTFKKDILLQLRTEAIKDRYGIFWSNAHLYGKGNPKSDTNASIKYWGDYGATAMAILNLQVFYRYGDITTMMH